MALGREREMVAGGAGLRKRDIEERVRVRKN